MSSVKTMVDNVLEKAGQQRISLLTIVDHGTPGALQIGDDWITDSLTLNPHVAHLNRLSKRFLHNGMVMLAHCQIGQNTDLLIKLSQVFGVKVAAGKSYTNAFFKFNYGDYVVADSDGNVTEQFYHPGIPAQDACYIE